MKCVRCDKDLVEGEMVYRTYEITDKCIVAKVDDSLDWVTVGKTILERNWTTCVCCFEEPIEDFVT